MPLGGGGGGGVSPPVTLSGGSAGAIPLTVVAPSGASALDDVLALEASAGNPVLEVTVSGYTAHTILSGNVGLAVSAYADSRVVWLLENATKLFSVYNATGTRVLGANADGGIFTAPPAPATQVFVSGAGAQLSTARDVRTVTPVTFNPGAATTATCLVEVSPDNVTYYALWTETVPAGVAFDGTIIGLCVYVPAAWRLRLTVNAQAVLGTTTYY